jgi:zinc transport system permease protein
MGDYLQMMSMARYMLIVGPLIGATCAILSVYVVLRRMALISEGVSHAGFGGIAVAVLVGYFVPVMETGSWGPVWREIITGAFCLGTAMLIGYVSRRKRVSEDSAIGIFLVASVAVGALLLSVRSHLPFNGHAMPVNVENLLFGDFTNVGPTDAIVVGCAMVVVFSIIGFLYFQFLYTTLDEEMARINGVNTKLINVLLLMMISLVIVVCVRMVGFLMITALTIIPGATAAMISRRFGVVLILSLVIGTLGTFVAVCLMLVDPITHYPPGPLIVLTLFAVFVVVWSIRHFRKPKVKELEPGMHFDAEHEHPEAAGSFGHGH